MKKILFYIALYAAKASQLLLKLLGRNATYFPGKVAEKICKNFLSYILYVKNCKVQHRKHKENLKKEKPNAFKYQSAGPAKSHYHHTRKRPENVCKRHIFSGYNPTVVIIANCSF